VALIEQVLTKVVDLLPRNRKSNLYVSSPQIIPPDGDGRC